MHRYRLPFLVLILAALLVALAFSYVPPALAAGSWSNVGTAGFSGGFADRPSLAFDSTGAPVIAYRDGTQGDKATVRKWDGSSWALVGSAGLTTGRAFSLSFAMHGDTPYVAYSDPDDGDIGKAVNFDGSDWVELTGGTGFSGDYVGAISIAVDSAGIPYVAFADGANGETLSVLKYNGSDAWDVVGENLSADYADSISLALDSNDIPIVAFADGANGSKLRVLKYNGVGAWDSPGGGNITTDYADYVSLALDDGDVPYVAFLDGANGDKATVLKYNSGLNSWSAVGGAGFSADYVAYTSLALSNDIPFVGYRDNGSGKLTVKQFDGSSWADIGIPQFSPGVVADVNLKFYNGTPYVVFQDGGSSGPASVMKYNAGAPAIVVTNNADSGAGSLRQAINDVDAGGTITFNNDYTITIGSTLTLDKDATIDGSGHAVTLDGANQYRVFAVNNGKTVTLNKLTVTNGKGDITYGSPSRGGGIVNLGTLTLTNSILSYNSATMGGGIYNLGTLTMQSSTISHNTATYDIAADTSLGGGIFNKGTVTIRNSTFSNNDATLTAVHGVPVSGGGAVYNSNPAGALDVSNSTFYANTGIGILNQHSTTLTNVTIANNATTGLWNAGVLNMTNSLIDTCRSLTTIAVSSHNLVGDAVVGTSERCLPTLVGPLGQLPPDFLTGYTGTDTFGNHGGATATVSLTSDSPAIDAGDAAACANATINHLDQRGYAHSDMRCDIGAYEVQLNEFTSVSKDYTPDGSWMTFGPMLGGVKTPAEGGGPYNFTLTRTEAAIINPPPPPGALPFSLDLAFNRGETGAPSQVYVMLCYDPATMTLPAGKVPRLFHYNGTSWDNLGGMLDKTTYLPYHCVTATISVSSFSPFVIVAEDAPTNSTLSKFNAAPTKKGAVSVKWATANESNVVGFNVWRKTGAGEWKTLNKAQIVARHAGELVGDKYAKTDKTVKPGKTYSYKLEIVFADGHSEWSDVKRVVVK